MKKILILAGLLVLGSFVYAEEKEVGASIGLVTGYSNGVYKKKSGKEHLFLPALEANYKNFYINQSELGYQLPLHDNFILSTYFDFLDGYPIKGKEMQSEYQTMKTRKSQTVGGARLTYLKDYYQTSLFIQGGKRGSSGGAEISVNFPVTEKVTLTTGLNYTAYSKKFTDYYFGVHKEDLGGALKKVYSPGKSYSYGAEVSLNYQMTTPLSVFTSVSATNYSKEITDSPFIKNKTNISTTMGIRYSF